LNLFTRPASGAEDRKPLINALKSVKAKDQAMLDVTDVLPGRCELRFYGAAKVPWGANDARRYLRILRKVQAE